ncbi:MAG: homoserine dehydrogenase [Granulosicoccaceae bacterium]
MKPVKIGLLGLGTVGRGTAQILQRNAGELERRCGRQIVIHSAAVRNASKAVADEMGIRNTSDGAALVADPEIDIVCEMMGGDHPALEWVLSAIKHGKHVITANKALIAVHGNQIFEAARKVGVVVAFEPAVAGGIPVIKALREGLAANQIQWVAGIINGTGNFILSEMASKGREFSDVLQEAQELGYAEADPTFDVEGIDAAHKLTIMASIAFGIPLQFDRVFTEGISKISREDVSYAEELGYRIKHLGIAKKTDKGIELRVHPTLIPHQRLIANVNGVMNAVLVRGDAVGPTMYYGPGAGAEPTGSAVVADIVDVVRVLDAAPVNQVPQLAFQAEALADLPILEPVDFESAYYLRVHAEDKPGVMASITGIFGKLGISIEAIVQKEPSPGEGVSAQPDATIIVPVILLTRLVREGLMLEAIVDIEKLDSVTQSVAMLRVEALN